ncbi:hypothetical protein ABEG17_03380 [Pedococcus sp. KACC 23699]|uniref:Glycosyltransferase family 4 protein n=1 Tax=Pedococcus sp. KACC 23699 TaxID=3149228 RepID=A0AAU7JW95_9MICO
MTWDFLPLASPESWKGGRLAPAKKALTGAQWLSRLALESHSHDIVHLHSAGVLRHARFALRRYVLHCHGTDVRVQQYLPAWSAAVRTGLRQAEAVFYSTPDLAEHILPHRSDAEYLPVPVDMSLLPRWTPTERPRVVFASRWGHDKGGAAQLDAAERIVAAAGSGAEMIGLDWGPMAEEARRRGVQLIERQDRAGYMSMLASAWAVVGQSTGMIGSSELEALGIGAPLVMSVPLPLYASAPPPVLGSSAEGAADAVAALVRGELPHNPQMGQEYVAARHGVAGALAQVLDTYTTVLAKRG